MRQASKQNWLFALLPGKGRALDRRTIHLVHLLPRWRRGRSLARVQRDIPRYLYAESSL
jgi:hypothetical protein